MGFAIDLPELAGGGGDLSAEIKARFRRWRAADDRRSILIEQCGRARQQVRDVRPEPGCEDDGVERLVAADGKFNLSFRESPDGAAHADGATLYLAERADVDPRHMAVLLDHLPRPLARRP